MIQLVLFMLQKEIVFFLMAVDVEMVITTLSTQFDPSLTDNRKFPAEHDMRLNVAWTKRERELAEKGAAVSDVSELQRKVSG